MTFKKKHIPWNKGLKGIHLSPKSEFKKGQRPSPTTEFKKGSMIRWKGEEAGYMSKHMWIYKHRGKPHYCEHCKRIDLKHRQYHWANISGEYLRDLSDWLRLCVKCHKKYDKK